MICYYFIFKIFAIVKDPKGALAFIGGINYLERTTFSLCRKLLLRFGSYWFVVNKRGYKDGSKGKGVNSVVSEHPIWEVCSYLYVLIRLIFQIIRKASIKKVHRSYI